jgi:hypothetical protein
VRDKRILDAIDRCNNQIDWNGKSIWSVEPAPHARTAQSFAEIATQDTNRDVAVTGISTRNDQSSKFGI